jgi:cytidylate kinase
MPGVTISAAYGAGGSVIAVVVARELGLPLLDRAISTTVAARMQVSIEEAEAGGATSRSLAGRFLSLLAPLSTGVLGAGTDAAPPNAWPVPVEAEAFREQAERVIRAALPAGAVILGRAGSVALREEPNVLRVRLFGPQEARVAQAARLEGVDEETVRKRMALVDGARRHYVKRLYHVDIDDPALYHLQIDSTLIPLDSCVELIARAYRAMPQT